VKRYLVFILFIAGSVNVFAEEVACTTKVNGVVEPLSYDLDEDALYANYSFREIFFGGSADNTCPAFIALRHLTPELTDQERSAFCLQFDDETDSYTGISQGERDAYLNCKAPSRSLCERVNASKDAAIAIAGFGAGATTGASVASGAAGVTAVAHSSGAMILTGSSGYIAGTLGSIGAGAVAVLTSPVTITGALVSVVAVGGAVYVCKEDSLPAELQSAPTD
jgi:hypothetical protein